jgi:hypothetical protein
VKLRVLVTDGVGIGHVSCRILHCANALENTQDRFCPGHMYRKDICAIDKCEQPVVPGRQTCSNVECQEREDLQHARNKALWQLKSRMARSSQAAEDAALNPEEDDSSCSDKPSDGVRKTRAIFGRRVSHNEQFFIYPCGIVAARRTFFGSETVPQLAVVISMTFLPFFVAHSVPQTGHDVQGL